MKQEVTDWIANLTLMSIGYYVRIIFGLDHFSKRQLIAFFVFCCGSVYIVDKINVATPWKLSIMLFLGLVIPNIIRIAIKTGNKSENKISDKLSDKITDKANDIIEDADKIKRMI